MLGRFLLLCLGVWLHAADVLVTATITPSIVDEIGGVAYVSWMISLYQVGAIIAGAASAMLCQRAKIKRVLIGAALLYGIGCVIAQEIREVFSQRLPRYFEAREPLAMSLTAGPGRW